MAVHFKPGEIAYILESNRIIREVIIVRNTGGMYLIRFADGKGGIQVKEHRLFKSKEEAENSIPGFQKKKRIHNPYDYEH